MILDKTLFLCILKSFLGDFYVTSNEELLCNGNIMGELLIVKVQRVGKGHREEEAFKGSLGLYQADRRVRMR